jgi:hypothetical protein
MKEPISRCLEQKQEEWYQNLQDLKEVRVCGWTWIL